MRSEGLPPDQEELDAPPPIDPANVCVLPSQIVTSAPALVVGSRLIVSTILSVAANHGPAGLSVVKVKVTVPMDSSASVGSYVAPKIDALSNVPVPEVVQVELEAPPPLTPDSKWVPPSQIVASAPALAVASGSNVSMRKSDAAVQDPAGSSVVIVSVTDPAVVSAGVGVYVVDTRLAFANVPVPEVDHVEEDALPPLVPATACVPLLHIVASAPAVAVATGSMVNTI